MMKSHKDYHRTCPLHAPSVKTKVKCTAFSAEVFTTVITLNMEMPSKPEDGSDFKTSLCSYFRRGGGRPDACGHGEKCRFAHGEEELRQRPDGSWDPTSMRGKEAKAENPLGGKRSSRPDGSDEVDGGSQRKSKEARIRSDDERPHVGDPTGNGRNDDGVQESGTMQEPPSDADRINEARGEKHGGEEREQDGAEQSGRNVAEEQDEGGEGDECGQQGDASGEWTRLCVQNLSRYWTVKQFRAFLVAQVSDGSRGPPVAHGALCPPCLVIVRAYEHGTLSRDRH